MPLTDADVIEALRPVEDPELHRSIVDLGMVREVRVALPAVSLQVALTIPGCPLKAEIRNRVTDAVRALDGVDSVEIDFTSMTDEERAALREQLHGDPGGPSPSPIPARAPGCC
jgi:ATP-binding protein involved in chromosome partitioning